MMENMGEVVDTTNAIEGEIVKEIQGFNIGVIEYEHENVVAPLSVNSEMDKDWHDEFEDYEDVKDKIRYLVGPTRYIFANNPDRKIVSPRDIGALTKIIYEEGGRFNAILERLNWHIASKKELLRWIRKHELNEDVMIAREGIVDDSEQVLVESVKTKDVESAKFVLKTVGKKRGWSEKDIDEREKNNVYAFINVSSLNTTGLKELSDSDLTKLLEDQIKGV